MAYCICIPSAPHVHGYSKHPRDIFATGWKMTGAIKKIKSACQVPEVQTCDPSYSGSKDQEDQSLRPTPSK
jgi:hypothetical protein